MGSLWYTVYGYDRETGECQGGLGSAGWNDGGPPVMAEPWRGFYCFGDTDYREQTIELMREHGFSWTMLSWNGWGDVDLDGTIEAQVSASPWTPSISRVYSESGAGSEKRPFTTD